MGNTTQFYVECETKEEVQRCVEFACHNNISVVTEKLISKSGHHGDILVMFIVDINEIDSMQKMIDFVNNRYEEPVNTEKREEKEMINIDRTELVVRTVAVTMTNGVFYRLKEVIDYDISSGIMHLTRLNGEEMYIPMCNVSNIKFSLDEEGDQ